MGKMNAGLKAFLDKKNKKSVKKMGGGAMMKKPVKAKMGKSMKTKKMK